MDCGTPPIPMDVRTATQTLLSVRNLKTYFPQDEGTVKAVDGVSFDLYSGRTLGIVGKAAVARVSPHGPFCVSWIGLDVLSRVRSCFGGRKACTWRTRRPW